MEDKRKRFKNPNPPVETEQVKARVKNAGASGESARPASRPAKSDTKDVWVDHAVAQGADRDEAEAMTKADLVSKYDEK